MNLYIPTLQHRRPRREPALTTSGCNGNVKVVRSKTHHGQQNALSILINQHILTPELRFAVSMDDDIGEAQWFSNEVPCNGYKWIIFNNFLKKYLLKVVPGISTRIPPWVSAHILPRISGLTWSFSSDFSRSSSGNFSRRTLI